MCATISTSPEPISVATQVTSPSASNFGANALPSSTSSVEPRCAKIDGPATESLARAQALSRAHHGDEADLLVRIVAEAAGELRGDRRRTRLFHAAQRHAHVLGFEHHGDAVGLEDLIDRGGNLRSEVLLRLQPPRIDIDQPRELG